MSLALRTRRSESAGPSTASVSSMTAVSGLKIGQPDSAFEHEADRVADEIMATSTPRLHWSLSKITTLQSKSVTSRSAIEHNSEVPSIVGEVLRSPGHPLDRSTSAFMEQRFGHDFSKVKVHNDSHATASAAAVNALAFTNGNHIVFAVGQYAPSTSWGRSLLAHELTHVLQQDATEHSILQRQPAQANQSAPSPGAQPSPPAPRQDFVFIMGEDRAGNPNKFYTAALGYYKAHLPNATFVTSIRNLSDLLDHLLANTKGPIGNLYIVSHANEDGTLSFGLDKPNEDKRMGVIELRDALHPKSGGKSALADVSSRIDTQTRIHIKGCDIGRTQQMVELIDEAFGGAGTVTAPTHEQRFAFAPDIAAGEAQRVETAKIAEFTSNLPPIPPLPPEIDKSLKGDPLKQAQKQRADEVAARNQMIAERPNLIKAERKRIKPEVQEAAELAGNVESFSGPMFQRPGTTLFNKDELAPQVAKLYSHLSEKQQGDMVKRLLVSDRRGAEASILGQQGQRVQIQKFSFPFADPHDAAEANRAFAAGFASEHFTAKNLVSVAEKGSQRIFTLEGRSAPPGQKAHDDTITVPADSPLTDDDLIAKAKAKVTNPERYTWRVEVTHSSNGTSTKSAIGERAIAYLHHGSLDPAPHQPFDRPESDPNFFATSTFAPPPATPPASTGTSPPAQGAKP
jgi:Domain of unknown function (DUF4157)